MKNKAVFGLLLLATAAFDLTAVTASYARDKRDSQQFNNFDPIPIDIQQDHFEEPVGQFATTSRPFQESNERSRSGLDIMDFPEQVLHQQFTVARNPVTEPTQFSPTSPVPSPTPTRPADRFNNNVRQQPPVLDSKPFRSFTATTTFGQPIPVDDDRRGAPERDQQRLPAPSSGVGAGRSSSAPIRFPTSESLEGFQNRFQESQQNDFRPSSGDSTPNEVPFRQSNLQNELGLFDRLKLQIEQRLSEERVTPAPAAPTQQPSQIVVPSAFPGPNSVFEQIKKKIRDSHIENARNKDRPRDGNRGVGGETQPNLDPRPLETTPRPFLTTSQPLVASNQPRGFPSVPSSSSQQEDLRNFLLSEHRKQQEDPSIPEISVGRTAFDEEEARRLQQFREEEAKRLQQLREEEAAAARRREQEEELAKIRRQEEAEAARKQDLERKRQEELLRQRIEAEMVRKLQEEEAKRLQIEARERQALQEARRKAALETEAEERRRQEAEAARAAELLAFEAEGERLRSGQTNSQENVLNRAKNVVKVKTELDTFKTSPAVWAAVKALSDFTSLSLDDRAVPRNILMAIIQLTDYLENTPSSDVGETSAFSAEERGRSIKNFGSDEEGKSIKNLQEFMLTRDLARKVPTTPPSSAFGARLSAKARHTARHRAQERHHSTTISSNRVTTTSSTASPRDMEESTLSSLQEIRIIQSTTRAPVVQHQAIDYDDQPFSEENETDYDDFPLLSQFNAAARHRNAPRPTPTTTAAPLVGSRTPFPTREELLNRAKLTFEDVDPPSRVQVNIVGDLGQLGRVPSQQPAVPQPQQPQQPLLQQESRGDRLPQFSFETLPV